MDRAKVNKQLEELGLDIHETEILEDLQMIRNPYYTGFLFIDSPEILELAKLRIEHIKKSLEKAENNKDYFGYVFLHERPFRLQAFLGIQEECLRLKNKSYTGELVGAIWIDSENPGINITMWKSLFEFYGKSLMSKEDKKFFKSLPEEFTVYHGDEGEHDGNISWSLSYDTASFFARRFTSNPRAVLEKVINKSEALCYFGSRGEQEIIIL